MAAQRRCVSCERRPIFEILPWARMGRRQRGARQRPADRQEDGVPNWSPIDAAFTDRSNTTWFFQGSRYVSVDAANRFGEEADIKQRWGRVRNEFTSPVAGNPAVVAAFTRDGRSYLIGPTSYTRYSGEEFMLGEPPVAQSLRAILDQLNCSNSADVPANAIDLGSHGRGCRASF